LFLLAGTAGIVPLLVGTDAPVLLLDTISFATADNVGPNNHSPEIASPVVKPIMKAFCLDLGCATGLEFSFFSFKSIIYF
jgi:hypothetical protein